MEHFNNLHRNLQINISKLILSGDLCGRGSSVPSVVHLTILYPPRSQAQPSGLSLKRIRYKYFNPQLFPKRSESPDSIHLFY